VHTADEEYANRVCHVYPSSKNLNPRDKGQEPDFEGYSKTHKQGADIQEYWAFEVMSHAKKEFVNSKASARHMALQQRVMSSWPW
jgi:hypothetical protein